MYKGINFATVDLVATKQDYLGYDPVPASRKVNGKELTEDITLTTADIGETTNKKYVTDAELTVLSHTSGINTGDQDISGLVPTTRTINGKALSSNITLSATDIGSRPYVFGIFYAGRTEISAIFGAHIFTDSVNLPASFTNSLGAALTAATSQTDFDIQLNGSSIGTMRFAASSSNATFIVSSSHNVSAGDILKFVAPASPDGTLADIMCSIRGTFI